MKRMILAALGRKPRFFAGIGNCKLPSIYCDLTFKVYDYGRRGILRDKSKAEVTLYHGDHVEGIFKAQEASDGSITPDNNWWHVFTIDGSTNKLKFSSSPPNSGSFLQRPPKVVPMNGTGYDGLGPFPRRKWKRRSQRDPELAKQRRAYFQHSRSVRTQQLHSRNASVGAGHALVKNPNEKKARTGTTSKGPQHKHALGK